MKEQEIKKLMDYVKKRYDEVSLDYKTFSGDIDTDISYAEQKAITNEELNKILPVVVKKPNSDEMKQIEQEQVRKEQERIKKEIQTRLDKDIESITKDSEELEKLYYFPKKYIEMIIDKKQKGLLLYGETSLGKSYMVKNVLKQKGKKDFCFISGHITPMRFYSKLYANRDNLVIFDDVNILESIIILNMIKASVNENSGNVVEYHTSKKIDIPNSFVFNGEVIILLNDIPKNNEHLKAVESRVLTYHLKFNYEEIIKIIFEIAHKTQIEGTTLQERLEVANWIREVTNQSTNNLNIRFFLQAIQFFKWNKENWKELSIRQIKTDENIQLIVQGVGEKDFIEKTGLHRATYYRLKQKLKT